MAKPVLYSIPAFDASKGCTFSFSYTGNRIVKSEALFYNNATGELVYGEGIYHLSQEHQYVLAPDKLANSSIPYFVILRVYDVVTGVSEYSDPVLFYCVTTPTFDFMGLDSTVVNELTDSSYTFSVLYSCAENENELLDSYFINFYDDSQKLISASPTLYKAGVPYGVLGLGDDKTYYVQAYGQTLNGMPLDTGLIELHVEYDLPTAPTTLDAENNYVTGEITLRAHFVPVDGRVSPEPAVFVDSYRGRALSLIEPGSYVMFDEGFELPAEYVMELSIAQFIPNSCFLTLRGETCVIRFYLVQGLVDTSTVYCAMIGEQNGKETRYTIQSNSISYGGDYIRLSIKREKNLWDMALWETSEAELTTPTISEEVG